MTSFGFNPVTSQLDLLGESGGGGGSISGIAGNDGGTITSGTVNFEGITYGDSDTQLIDTNVDGNTLYIENMAKITPYIVNASEVPGIRGTYGTIQDAIDAAIIDGCTIANQKCGLIYAIGTLPGFTIPSDAYITVRGVGNSGRDASLFSGTTINSTITIEPNCIANLEDLTIFSTSGNGLNVVDTPASININQCSFLSTGDYSFNYNGDMTPLIISNSVFSSPSHFVNPYSNESYCQIYSSKFQSSILFEQGGAATFNGCNIGSIQLNAVSKVNIFNCTEENEFILTGNSSQICYVSNVILTNGASTNPVFNTAQILLGNLTLFDTQSPQRTLSGGTATIYQSLSYKGNITSSTTLTTSGTLSYLAQFVWCDHTGPIGILLAPDAIDNQEIVIKDKSLNASTNNITLSLGGGSIDGQPTLVMNQDGQCVRLKKFGGNYFTI